MTSPLFSRLVCQCLHERNISSLTPEILRRAKHENTPLLIPLWQTIHDLIVFLLLQRKKTLLSLKTAHTAIYQHLNEAQQMRHYLDIIRFYLYSWGYGQNHIFQDNITNPDGVLALAWLIARGKIFTPLHEDAVVEKEKSHIRVPPYPLRRMIILDDQRRHIHKSTGILPNPHWLLGRIQRKVQACKMKGDEIIHLRQRVLKSQRRQTPLSEYQLDLVRYSSFLEKNERAMVQRMEMYTAEETFYQWTGTVYVQSKTIQRTVPQDDSISGQGIVFTKRLLFLLEQKQQWINISQKWRQIKNILGDAEFRRQQHRLKALSTQIDREFPHIQERLTTFMSSSFPVKRLPLNSPTLSSKNKTTQSQPHRIVEIVQKLQLHHDTKII